WPPVGPWLSLTTVTYWLALLVKMTPRRRQTFGASCPVAVVAIGPSGPSASKAAQTKLKTRCTMPVAPLTLPVSCFLSWFYGSLQQHHLTDAKRDTSRLSPSP